MQKQKLKSDGETSLEEAEKVKTFSELLVPQIRTNERKVQLVYLQMHYFNPLKAFLWKPSFIIKKGSIFMVKKMML